MLVRCRETVESITQAWPECIHRRLRMHFARNELVDMNPGNLLKRMHPQVLPWGPRGEPQIIIESLKVVGGTRVLLVFRNTRYTYEHAHEHEITLPYCICLLQTTHVSRCDHVRDKGPDKDARGRTSMANEGHNGPGACNMHAGGRSRDLRAQTHTQAAAPSVALRAAAA